jgi:hypothetical protein
MRDEFEKFRFPQMTSNKKELLCVLGQYVFDREAPAMSQEDRDELVDATKKAIRSVMNFLPRSL